MRQANELSGHNKAIPHILYYVQLFLLQTTFVVIQNNIRYANTYLDNTTI